MIRFNGSIIENLPSNEKKAVKPNQYLVKKGKLLNQSAKSDMLKPRNNFRIKTNILFSSDKK